MKADKVNQWLALIANISVVAGIVFLAVEVRQNTESQDEFNRVTRANAYQARAFAASSLWSDIAASPEMVQTLVAFNEAGGFPSATEALATLSDEDRIRTWHYALAQIAILDNNVHQFRQGYLDPDRYQRIDSLNLKYLIPLFDALGMKYTTDMAGEVERLRGE